MLGLCRSIGRTPKGGVTPTDILRAYVGIKQKRQENLVAPSYRPAFKPMEGIKHPRMADIQKAQPPLITPCGTGNGTQYSKFMFEDSR